MIGVVYLTATSVAALTDTIEGLPCCPRSFYLAIGHATVPHVATKVPSLVIAIGFLVVLTLGLCHDYRILRPSTILTEEPFDFVSGV